MKKQRDNRKSTNISVSVKFEVGIHPAKASVNINGDIIFFDVNGDEIEPNSMKREMTHDRVKGPKVRTRQVLEHGEGTFSGLQQLAEYEVIFAIDTNTDDVGGKKVSITAFMPFSLEPNGEGYTVRKREDHVQIYEIEGATQKPELRAILKLALDLKKHGSFGQSDRVAILTDTELGSLDEFNARKIPIYENHFLPDGFTLLYASSDTGWEVLNKFIRICDKAAEQTIKERQVGEIPDAPFVPLEGFSKTSIRVGRRNAQLIIDNPSVAHMKIQPGQKISLYGRKKKS